MTTLADVVFYLLILLSMLIVVCFLHNRSCECKGPWQRCESFLVAMGALGLLSFVGLAGIVYMIAKGIHP